MPPDDDPTPLHAVLSPRDQTVIAAVVAGESYTDAGTLSGVSESTVYRTMRRPEVRAAVTEARAVRAARIADLLGERVETALAALDVCMESGDSLPARVSAARVVLAEARRWSDHADLADRVHALEDALRAERDHR